MENLKKKLSVERLIVILGYANEMDRNKWNLFFPYRKLKKSVAEFVNVFGNDEGARQRFGFVISRDLSGVMFQFNDLAWHNYLKRCYIAPMGAPTEGKEPSDGRRPFIPWTFGPNTEGLIPMYAVKQNGDIVSVTYTSKSDNVRWGSESKYLFQQADSCVFFGGGKIAMNEEIPMAIAKATDNKNFKIVIIKNCGGVSEAKIPELEAFKEKHPNQVFYANNGNEAAKFLIRN